MRRVRSHRRGNAALVGVCLAALLGFGSVSVDVAMQRVTNARVQAAAEAGVLAGAGYLNRTAAGMVEAKQKAAHFANANPVGGGWTLTVDEVEVGIYDRDAGTFTPVDPAGLEAGDPLVNQTNAVRIVTTHSISALLSKVFGVTSLDTHNTALAVREPNRGSARSVPCVLPLAIPDCDYRAYLDGTNTSGVNPPGFRFQQSNANVDNIGWANQFIGEDFGTDEIIERLAGGGCDEDDLVVGEQVEVKNGQNTAVLHFLDKVFNGQHPSVAPDSWDHDIAPRPPRDGHAANCPPGQAPNASGVCESPGGNPNIGSVIDPTAWANLEPVIQGPVALVRPHDCNNIQFTGLKDVSGFAWAMIYDVGSSGSEKNVWVQLDFVNEHDFGGQIDESGNGPITGLDDPLLIR